MFQRILVPLDGSTSAEQALPLAIRLAQASGGTLLLLQVVPPASDAIHTTPQEPRHALRSPAFREADAYLSHLLAREQFEGIGINKEVRSGSPVQQILLSAKEHQMDLIVICSHATTGLKRMLTGSVAQKVAQHSPITVLLLRAGHPLVPASLGAQGRATQVLVALNGSPLAETALMPAAQISSALSAPACGKLHLAHVVVRTLPVKDIAGVMACLDKEDIALANRYLHRIEQRLQEGEFASLHLSVVSSAVPGADIVNPLLWLSEEGNYSTGHGLIGSSDLIAIATHGRSGLAHWAMGSIAEHILASTTLPMLIVHAEPLAQTSNPGADQQRLHGVM